MAVNNVKIVKSAIGKQIDLPIEMKWDFSERDQAIDVYQTQILNELIGEPNDFELYRFAHDEYFDKENQIKTKLYYEFYFYNTAASINNPIAWQNSYLYNGFTTSDVYYFNKPFTKSFFKLDFYDTTNVNTQKNYFTIILPVQQGETEIASISTFLSNLSIKKPKFGLDYIGDKEGFFIYWLRKRNYIDLDTFYMSAKFFNARVGEFIRMMNVPQGSFAGNYYTFDIDEYFYYKVTLDYNEKSYQVFKTSNNLRVGTDINPIEWYEYRNP